MEELYLHCVPSPNFSKKFKLSPQASTPAQTGWKEHKLSDVCVCIKPYGGVNFLKSRSFDPCDPSTGNRTAAVPFTTSHFLDAQNKMHPKQCNDQSAQMNETPQLRHHALNAMKVLDVIDEGQMSNRVDEIVHRMITAGLSVQFGCRRLLRMQIPDHFLIVFC